MCWQDNCCYSVLVDNVLMTLFLIHKLKFASLLKVRESFIIKWIMNANKNTRM